MALGYRDFLGGLEEGPPLKEWRCHIKNKIFRVSGVMTLFGKLLDFWTFFQDVVLISKLLDDHRDALKAKEGKVANLHQGWRSLALRGRQRLRRSVD